MSPPDTPATSPAPPHPLARALAAVLTPRSAARVLVLGYGSGRNLPILFAAGARIDVLEHDPARAAAAADRFGRENVRLVKAPSGPYDGALSTHALLHGTRAEIADLIRAIEAALRADAPLYATLGSKADPRFGEGRRIAPDTFAPLDGPEAGVPHSFFDEAGARALLRGFTLDELREDTASETAGTWAHTPAESATLRHWFLRARRSPSH